MNFDRELRRFKSRRRGLLASEVKVDDEFAELITAVNNLKPQLDKIKELIDGHYDELKTHLKRSDIDLYNKAERNLRPLHYLASRWEVEAEPNNLSDTLMVRIVSAVVNAMDDQLLDAWNHYSDEKTEDDDTAIGSH